MNTVQFLSGLIIEDDPETLEQMLKYLAEPIDGVEIDWEGAGDFALALHKLKFRRYDLVITDVYALKKGATPTDDDNKAKNVVDQIRRSRMCPIIVYSTRAFERSEPESPFLVYLDKGKPEDEISDAIATILKTGIPLIARRLHDELDQSSGPGYLWSFLEENWRDLERCSANTGDTMERLVRKRASIQFSRLDSNASLPAEVVSVCAADFYIMPPIAESLRLGQILRRKSDNRYLVVLTPHCFLQTQAREEVPRAEYVLTTACKPMSELLKKFNRHKNLTGSDREDNLRRYVQAPSGVGKPEGRYWFLPGFLSIPDMCCDFMEVNSILMSSMVEDFDRIAVLDVPYAESLQACFTRFFSSVGLPPLGLDGFAHFFDAGGVDAST